jgi:hypothetical protein
MGMTGSEMSNILTFEMSIRGDYLSALLVSALAVAGCGVSTQERRVIVLDKGSIERQMLVARAYVTDKQVSLLRLQARSRFPDLREPDVRRLQLSWKLMPRYERASVAVVVTFTTHRAELNAKQIANYVADQVTTELRSKLDGAGASIYGSTAAR